MSSYVNIVCRVGSDGIEKLLIYAQYIICTQTISPTLHDVLCRVGSDGSELTTCCVNLRIENAVTDMQDMTYRIGGKGNKQTETQTDSQTDRPHPPLQTTTIHEAGMILFYFILFDIVGGGGITT